MDFQEKLFTEKFASISVCLCCVTDVHSGLLRFLRERKLNFFFFCQSPGINQVAGSFT